MPDVIYKTEQGTYEAVEITTTQFQRYLNNFNIDLHCTVYLWDEQQAEHLREKENKTAFDFYRREWADENKKYKAMPDIGLPRQYWDSIKVLYRSEELYLCSNY